MKPQNAARMANMNSRTPLVYERIEATVARREEPSLNGNTLRKDHALLTESQKEEVQPPEMVLFFPMIHLLGK